MAVQQKPADGSVAVTAPSPRMLSEDLLAVLCGGFLLLISLAAVLLPRAFEVGLDAPSGVAGSAGVPAYQSMLQTTVAEPGKWTLSPVEAFYKEESAGQRESPIIVNRIPGIIGAVAILALVMTLAVCGQGERPGPFVIAFAGVALLSTFAFLLASQAVIKAMSLEYALWALLAGMWVSNTVGVPNWLRPAVRTELYIKTGLVIFGAEVLVGRLLALGVPGIFVAWVVTPIVLVATYWFGQRILRMPSKSLNMVISADMSVCGVSAAIATAAACRAKKEELSLAVGMSLSFTVVMMILLPIVVRVLGIDPILGGAWIGGTIDSTGAVAAAANSFGKEGAEVAMTTKMIQNILIGVIAFGVATYWTVCVDRDPAARQPEAVEIWRRFPKFVLGFLFASLFFSLLHGQLADGPQIIKAMLDGSSKSFRGWLFCLAFVSIGLATNFRQLAPFLRGGKPLVLYVCGQSLNLCLTLFMAWLMFKVIFADLAH